MANIKIEKPLKYQRRLGLIILVPICEILPSNSDNTTLVPAIYLRYKYCHQTNVRRSVPYLSVKTLVERTQGRKDSPRKLAETTQAETTQGRNDMDSPTHRLSTISCVLD